MCENESFIFQAMEAAKYAEATIIVAGLDLSVEAESLDRVNLTLPGYQEKLIDLVAQSTLGPVILVIMSAGGVDISFAKDNPNIKSILWAGYPGEEGGQAIADVIFGKYNPGGRLPLTWFANDYVNLLPMTSMPLRPIESLGYPGRTYKFYNGPTVYPFGFGLSYTKFNYNLTSAHTSINLNMNKFQHCRSIDYTDAAQMPACAGVLIDDMACQDQFSFEVEVQNVGDRDGSEVVIVYSTPPQGIKASYIKQVIGFQRVFVAAGGVEKVKFDLNVCKSLAIVDYAANTLLPSGGHTITIGDSGNSFPFQVNLSR